MSAVSRPLPGGGKTVLVLCAAHDRAAAYKKS